MRTCRQRAAVAPLLLEGGSSCILVNSANEVSIHIHVHLAEQRTCFVDDAEALAGKVKPDRCVNLLGQLEGTAIRLTFSNITPLSGIDKGGILVIVNG